MQIFEGIKAVAQCFVGIARRIDRQIDDASGGSLKTDPPTPHDLRPSAIRESRLGICAMTGSRCGPQSNDVHDIYDHYDRLPEKRAALEMWERHLRKVIADHPQTDGKVLPLRR